MHLQTRETTHGNQPSISDDFTDRPFQNHVVQFFLTGLRHTNTIPNRLVLMLRRRAPSLSGTRHAACQLPLFALAHVLNLLR
ncbi:hypothetical protein, partial [Ralstonia pseudosolanacearum]|uniref:hypothetical protein n=1 Tax=Ralstonia pseudosolanacearum TaxID=1310165 RepID=UPI0032221D25